MSELITLVLEEHAELNGMTLREYTEKLLVEQKGVSQMGDMRTVAFKVDEDLFQRLKDHLKENKISQQVFFTTLLEQVLPKQELSECMEQNEVEDTERMEAEELDQDSTEEATQEDAEAHKEEYEGPVMGGM